MSKDICTKSCTKRDNTRDLFGYDLERPPEWLIQGVRKIAEDITASRNHTSWEQLLSLSETKLESLKSEINSRKGLDRAIAKRDFNALDYSIGVLKRLIRLNMPYL